MSDASLTPPPSCEQDPGKFKLEELKFAHELCFPDTFERLFRKHTGCRPETAAFHAMECKRKGGLWYWLGVYSRKDLLTTFPSGLTMGEVINRMIAELIGPGDAAHA